MIMTKIHEFDPVIYPYRLWIVVDKTTDFLCETFTEYNHEPIVFADGFVDTAEAFTMAVRKKETKEYGVVVFMRSKKDMSYKIAAHEASHAAKLLFEHIGADMKEHEPFEYVVGWIADCIYKVKTGKI